MASAKVVGIHGGSIDQIDRAKPYPSLLMKVRDDVKEQLAILLRKLFDSADDALFAMADKASSSSDQTMYFDAMRELRLQKKQIATGVVSAVLRSFNDLVGHHSQGDSYVGEEPRKESGLIRNDEFELNIAIEAMCSKVRDASGPHLDELLIRFESFASLGRVSQEQMPASPEILCESFVKASEILDLPIRARLVLLKLYEKYVLTEFIPVYADINQLMETHGIIPNIKDALMSQRPPKKGEGAPSNLVDELDDDLIPTLTVAISPSVESDNQIDTLTDLTSLLHSSQAKDDDFDPPLLNLSHYSRTDLLCALSVFQAEQFRDPAKRDTTKVIDYRGILNARLDKSQDVSSTFSQMDDDIINLVSMLFEFILDDPQVQSDMKALISRMQIPILKVALMDNTFFGKEGHPARKLLNKIASSAIGWSPVEDGKPDKLKDKIESVINAVLQDFDDSVDLFVDLLEDFSNFVDLEHRRGLLIERRIKDSEQGKAANELARKKVQGVMNAAMTGKTVPACLIEILRDGLSGAMVLHLLKGDEGEQDWHRDCQLVKDLIFTVSPDTQDEETYSTVMRLIPNVMTQLRASLKDVAFDEEKTKQLVKALEDEHFKTLGRLRGIEDVSVEEPVQSDVVESVASQPVDSFSEEVIQAQNEAIEELVRSTIEQQSTVRQVAENQDDVAFSASDLELGDDLSEVADHAGSISSDAFVETEDSASSLADAAEAQDALPADDEPVTEPEPVAEKIVLIEEEQAPVVEIDENDPIFQQVDKFAPGCWFEISTEGKEERCKLAAVIKVTGKFVFVNRSGVKVAEKTRMELAVELRSGAIQILNDGLLFDRALESVITNLRSKADS